MYQEKILESASILFFIWRLIQSSKVEYVLVFSIFSVLKTLKLTGEKLVYCFIDLSIIIGYVDWTAVFPVLNQYWCVYFSPEALFSSSCVYAVWFRTNRQIKPFYKPIRDYYTSSFETAFNPLPPEPARSHSGIEPHPIHHF